MLVSKKQLILENTHFLGFGGTYQLFFQIPLIVSTLRLAIQIKHINYAIKAMSKGDARPLLTDELQSNEDYFKGHLTSSFEALCPSAGKGFAGSVQRRRVLPKSRI